MDTCKEDEQMELPHCLAPCWPIVCRDCPFGDLNTTFEEFEKMIPR
jgi:hypothetical protein